MATVIDALIVTLGLDGSKFKVGAEEVGKARKKLGDQSTREDADQSTRERKLHEEQRKRAQEMDTRAKAMAQGFAKIRNEALALFAVFTAGVGVKDFVSNTINSAASLGMLSANLSMSTESLSAWQRASERAGGTAEGMVAQLRESAGEIARLKSGLGPSEGMQWFFRAGGSAADLKDGNSLLMARSKIVANLFKTDPAKAALVASQMGIKDDVFDLIKQGPDAIKALVAAQEKNSAVTAKGAKEALELRNAMLDLRDRLQSTATSIILHLAPSIESAAKRLEKLADWVANHKTDISEWIDSAVKSISEFVKMVDGAAESVGGWKNVLIGLAAIKVLSMTSSLISLAASLVSVGSALDGIATLGPLALVALVGVGSYKLGEELGKLLPDSVRDAIGEFGARTMASFGSKDAGEAIRINTGKDDYLTGPENSAIRQLIKSGWTQDQAAGIVANFRRESGMNPNKPGDNGAAYGIAQWHKDRQADFKKWSGKDIIGSKAEDQIAFFDYELRHGKEQAAGRRLMAAKTSAEAAAIVSRYGERPADADGEAAKRASAAAGMSRALGAANAASAARMPSGAAVSAPVAAGAQSTSTSTSETKIGTINVQTQATDAAGIARAIGGEVAKYGFVMQANSGVR